VGRFIIVGIVSKWLGLKCVHGSIVYGLIVEILLTRPHIRQTHSFSQFYIYVYIYIYIIRRNKEGGPDPIVGLLSPSSLLPVKLIVPLLSHALIKPGLPSDPGSNSWGHGGGGDGEVPS